MFAINMDKIKIRLGEACNNDSVFDIEEMTEYDDRIIMVIGKTEAKIGETVTFSRVLCGEGGKEVVRLSDEVKVLNVENCERGLRVETEKIPIRYLTLKDMGDVPYETYEDGGDTYINVLFNERHTAFPMDLFRIQDNYGQTLIFRDFKGNSIAECLVEGISNTPGTLFYEDESQVEPAGTLTLFDRNTDCLKLQSVENTVIDPLTQIDMSDSCGIRTYEYVFLPSKANMYGVVLKFDRTNAEISEILENTAYCELKFNPYYYYIETTVDNNVIKECHLYKDSKWIELYGTIDFENRYVNYANGKNKTNVAIYRRYWKAGLPLSSENISNDCGLGNSSIIERYENSIVDSLPIIDMERVRLYPNCLKMSFIFHFRPRIENPSSATSENSELTKDYPYTDRWSVDENRPEEWNTIDFSEHMSAGTQTMFFSSDLLGFLNFSDNDIYYRKKKITQTFVRLLFYDSPDPISQKLLYYSTVFLDATGLYSKYIKQVNSKPRNPNFIGVQEHIETSKIAFWNTGDKLDTQIDITHEFDRTRSSEGFYLYLFNQDLQGARDGNGYLLGADGEKKKIYLKVEFNHAGNGKTVAMMTMPFNHETSKYEAISMDNIYENLYIPVYLHKIGDVWQYEIQNTYREDNTLKIVLFEPLLNVEDYSSNNNVIYVEEPSPSSLLGLTGILGIPASKNIKKLIEELSSNKYILDDD